jgi:hypothetical protein
LDKNRSDFVKIKLRDKHGWPVSFIKNKPFTNIIRALIHTNIKRTLFYRRPGTKRFTIAVEMQERWIPDFLSMLNYMQHLGSVGSSRKVTLYSDGDGDFRPRFKPSIEYKKVEPRDDSGGNRLYDAG